MVDFIFIYTSFLHNLKYLFTTGNSKFPVGAGATDRKIAIILSVIENTQKNCKTDGIIIIILCVTVEPTGKCYFFCRYP
jgi:hypothetical protein